VEEKVTKTAEEILVKILTLLGLEFKIESVPKEDCGKEWIEFQITTPEPGFIIGYHGQTLRDLEFLVNLAVFRKIGQWARIVLNVGEYQERRENFLKTMALKTAEKAKFLKEPIALSPMPGKERRIVHLALQEDSAVKTESAGEGEKRKVVIYPNNSSLPTN